MHHVNIVTVPFDRRVLDCCVDFYRTFRVYPTVRPLMSGDPDRCYLVTVTRDTLPSNTAHTMKHWVGKWYDDHPLQATSD